MLWLDSTNATRHRRSPSGLATPDRSGSGTPEDTVRSWSLISLRRSAVSAISHFPHPLVLPTPAQFESATTLKAAYLAMPALASASRAKRHRKPHVPPATRPCVFVSPGEMCFVRAPPRFPQHLGSPTRRAPPLDQTARYKVFDGYKDISPRIVFTAPPVELGENVAIRHVSKARNP